MTAAGGYAILWDHRRGSSVSPHTIQADESMSFSIKHHTDEVLAPTSRSPIGQWCWVFTGRTLARRGRDSDNGAPAFAGVFPHRSMQV